MARALRGLCSLLPALGLLRSPRLGSAFHSVPAYFPFHLVDDRARIDFGARPAWLYYPPAS
ncbi:MAG: hypothetical protein IPN17_26980 [Deltaproteobacteria bacterium]|nr:hypothetical protein [Deltaproteobacteria bacterium]